jgi:hypothetical protein
LKEDFVLKIAYDDTENKVSINSEHWKFIETISFNRFETELVENAQLTEHDCLKMVK